MEKKAERLATKPKKSISLAEHLIISSRVCLLFFLLRSRTPLMIWINLLRPPSLRLQRRTYICYVCILCAELLHVIFPSCYSNYNSLSLVCVCFLSCKFEIQIDFDNDYDDYDELHRSDARTTRSNTSLKKNYNCAVRERKLTHLWINLIWWNAAVCWRRCCEMITIMTEKWRQSNFVCLQINKR